MTREQVFDEVKEIFCDLLDDDDAVITEETSRENLEKWDSLFHMTLMATVTDEFSIEISTEEITDTKTVKALVDLISERAQ